LTDATDDFDFVLKEETDSGPISRLVYETPDGEQRTDTWLSNREEAVPRTRTPSEFRPRYDATDPWQADTDSDGLTDGQELRVITIYSPGIVYVDRELNYYITNPLIADTDGDDSLDGGGHIVVAGAEIGRTVSPTSEYVEKGEMWNLPTSPGHPDVVEFMVVVDQAYKESYGLKGANGGKYIRMIISQTNGELEGEFKNYEKTPHVVITEMVQWNFPEPDVPADYDNYIKKESPWNEEDTELKSEHDLIFVMSNEEMGANYEKSAIGLVNLAPYADAVSRNRRIIIGINDPIVEYGPDHLAPTTNAVNLFLHELGHRYGAKHPEKSTKVPNGTGGVMCKYTCYPPTPNMLTTRDISDKMLKYHIAPNVAEEATHDNEESDDG
jgi:hypothetical protein